MNEKSNNKKSPVFDFECEIKIYLPIRHVHSFRHVCRGQHLSVLRFRQCVDYCVQQIFYCQTVPLDLEMTSLWCDDRVQSLAHLR